MSVSKLRSCCTNSPLPFETYNLWTSALEWRIFGIRRSFNFFARRLSTAHFSTLVGSGDHFHFINHSPLTRDLQTFLLFSQHLTWVITPPNQNSVFYGLTSAIKHTFITNQGTRRSQLYNCSWLACAIEFDYTNLCAMLSNYFNYGTNTNLNCYG